MRPTIARAILSCILGYFVEISSQFWADFDYITLEHVFGISTMYSISESNVFGCPAWMNPVAVSFGINFHKSFLGSKSCPRSGKGWVGYEAIIHVIYHLVT